MKPLVIFYSRTGWTKKVAENISKNLNCDIEEVVDHKKRNGLFRFITSGRDAMKKKTTVPKHLMLD